MVKRVARSGFPIVLVNRRSSSAAGSVVMNDARSSEVAVNHFVGLGHRRIGHIAGPSNIDTGRRRLAGFRAALRQHGLPLRAEWIAETDYTEAGGIAAAERILKRSAGDLPTAIYIASFMSGVGAVQVFNQAGLRIPDDLSVIVSDELTLAAHTAPPLTTVRMPVRRMGEVATHVLLKAVAGEPVVDIMLPDEPELVIRASTAPPRADEPAGKRRRVSP
jgi:LacI family transcriptional regulator